MSRVFTTTLLAFAFCACRVADRTDDEGVATPMLIAPSFQWQTRGSVGTDCEREPVDWLLDECAAGSAAVLDLVGYPTVEGALVAASTGSIVWVCPGIHAVSTTVQDIAVAAIDPAPGATVLSGSGSRRIFTTGSGWLLLDGIELRDGFDALTGGALDATNTDLYLLCTTFAENTAYNGGALRIRSGTTISVSSTFLDNSADYSGGAIDAGDWDPTVLSVHDSIFTGNTAGYEGGALSVGLRSDDTVSLVNTDFTHNFSANNSASVLLSSWGTVRLDAIGGNWSDNVTVGDGGALTVGGWLVDARLELTGVNMERNIAYHSPAIEIGGNVYGGRIAMREVSIWANEALQESGAAIEGWDPVHIDCRDCNFGVDADDNIPYDVSFMGPLGDGESFRLP